MSTVDHLIKEWEWFTFDKPNPPKNWTQDQRWRNDNPGEYAQLVELRDTGKEPTSINSVTGKRMLENIRAYRTLISTTPPTPLPTPGKFGAKLPARLPTSTGSVIPVSTVAQLNTQLASCAYGSVIDGGGRSFDLSATSMVWPNGRNGNGVVTTLRNCVFTSSPTDTAAVLIYGDWFRLQDCKVNNSRMWGVKVENATHIELQRVVVRDSVRSSFMVGYGSTDWQLWDCESYDVGQIPNNDGFGAYGIYAESYNDKCVVANMLCVNPERWAWHVYTGYSQFTQDGLIVTGCTAIHSGTGDRGGAIIDASDVSITNVKLVGLICVDSPTGLIDCKEPLSGGNRLAGAVEWRSKSTNYQIANMQPVNHVTSDPQLDNNYRPGSGSSAIGIVPADWHDYLPATDLDGNPRVTADAGAYAA